MKTKVSKALEHALVVMVAVMAISLAALLIFKTPVFVYFLIPTGMVFAAMYIAYAAFWAVFGGIMLGNFLAWRKSRKAATASK